MLAVPQSADAPRMPFFCQGNGSVGIDVENCVTADRGVLDLLHTKREAIKMATDAAVTVLRVDQIIMAKPAGGPKASAQGGGDDD